MPGTELIEEIDTQQLSLFFEKNLLLLILVALLLVGLYVVAPRIVHVLVRRTLEAQAGELEEGGVQATELDKRSNTLESLATTLVRVTVLATIFIIFIGMFGLWSVLTGIGLFFAAVVLAGQSIVLDYLMGILIVVEGTYFEGDNISAGDPAWNIFGTVEDVGLRRTVIRGPDGTVHSISNGDMRRVSNRTRIYAAAEVKVRGIRDEDLDRAIEIMERTGRDVAEEPRFAKDIMEAHTLKFVDNPDDLGITAIMRGRVVAAQRWGVATEIRRRLNRAFLEEGIELNKRGVAPRIPRAGGGEAPPYVPEDDD